MEREGSGFEAGECCCCECCYHFCCCKCCVALLLHFLLTWPRQREESFSGFDLSLLKLNRDLPGGSPRLADAWDGKGERHDSAE